MPLLSPRSRPFMDWEIRILSQDDAASGSGERIDQRKILRRLAELQYTRNDFELHRATYRVRGEGDRCFSCRVGPGCHPDRAV